MLRSTFVCTYDDVRSTWTQHSFLHSIFFGLLSAGVTDRQTDGWTDKKGVLVLLSPCLEKKLKSGSRISKIENEFFVSLYEYT